MAVLLVPVPLLDNDRCQIAVFSDARFAYSAPKPMAVFSVQKVLLVNAEEPKAVFHIIFHLQRPSIISQPILRFDVACST